ncbi:MAG: hypothetical protein IJU16_03540 [Clostridia bacterium]|nr:hypothetical protein [Clostridia bacterium]
MVPSEKERLTTAAIRAEAEQQASHDNLCLCLPLLSTIPAGFLVLCFWFLPFSRIPVFLVIVFALIWLLPALVVLVGGAAIALRRLIHKRRCLRIAAGGKFDILPDRLCDVTHYESYRPGRGLPGFDTMLRFARFGRYWRTGKPGEWSEHYDDQYLFAESIVGEDVYIVTTNGKTPLFYFPASLFLLPAK